MLVGLEVSFINKHRQGGVYDESDPPFGGQELRTFTRIKAALQHPNAPECVDGFTDLEMSLLAKHIAIRLVRGGPEK